MRKYQKQVLFGMAFMLAITITIVLLSNLRDLAAQLQNFPLWYFLPIIGLKCINWLLRYLEWHYFLHVINVQAVWQGETRPPLAPDQPATIRIQDSFLLWMASLPFALSPGKIAEVLKAIILKSMIGTPISRSTPIILAERIVDGIAVIILVVIAGLASSEAISKSDGLSPQTIQWILLLTSLMMLILIGVVQFPRLAHRLIHLSAYMPLIRRFEPAILDFYDSSHDLAKIRHIIPTTFFGMGAYFTDCVGFYLMLIGLGQAPSWQLFSHAVFILGFSVVISAISAMPGGAGGRELTVGALLKSMLSMSTAATTAAVLMIGIFQVWFGALIGILLGLLFRNRLFPPSLEAEIAAYEHRTPASLPDLDSA